MFHRSLRLAACLVIAFFAAENRLSAAPDLLDPASVGAANKAPAAASASGRSPGYARGMAESVVSSMDGLTRSAAGLLEDIAKLEARIRDLERQLADLIAKKSAEMSDYWNGLFCSGCNRTKTDIESHGDTFPHPGQHIVQPTAEQIDAKDRELQAPIDQLSRELMAARARLAKAKAERDEALIQIDQGFKCWQTSIVFEDILIHREARGREAADRRKSSELADRASALRTQIMALKTDDPHRLELARDLDKIRRDQQKLENDRAAARRDLDSRVAQAAANAGAEAAALNGFLSRGTLGLSVAPESVANPASGSIPGGNFAGGGLYRMGDFSPARHDETLPPVDQFIAAFFASSQEDMVRAFTRRNPLPASPPSLINDAKGELHDLIKALAPPQEPKKQPTNSGPGTRG